MDIHIDQCPFCGEGEARDGVFAQDFATIVPRSADGNLLVNMDGFGWYWVFCGRCGARGPQYHGETYATGNTGPKNLRRDKAKTAQAIKTAVEAWNKRAQPTLFGGES